MPIRLSGMGTRITSGTVKLSNQPTALDGAGQISEDVSDGQQVLVEELPRLGRPLHLHQLADREPGRAAPEP